MKGCFQYKGKCKVVPELKYVPYNEDVAIAQLNTTLRRKILWE
jgi:hypothetical protein